MKYGFMQMKKCTQKLNTHGFDEMQAFITFGEKYGYKPSMGFSCHRSQTL